MSSEIACRAASLISKGAAKSGNPCDRFTALYFSASRVISRITDSVNCSAFAESIRRATCAMVVSGVVIIEVENQKFKVECGKRKERRTTDEGTQKRAQPALHRARPPSILGNRCRRLRWGRRWRQAVIRHHR